jgi:hypothetical protein
MSNQSKSVLDPESPVNSVAARLALYATLAGAVAAGTAVAIRRRAMRDADATPVEPADQATRADG